MKKKTIAIIAILLILVTLATFMVACKEDEPEEPEKTPTELATEAVESRVRASVIAKMVLGTIPSDWNYNFCTVMLTENSDGTYSAKGKAYIYGPNSQKASASYTAKVSADYEVSSCDVGTFYKN